MNSENGKGPEASKPGFTLLPTHGYTHWARSSLEFCSLWIFMEALSVGLVTYLSHQPLTPRPSPEEGVAWNFQASNHGVIFLVTQPLFIDTPSHFIRTGDAPTVTQETPRGLGALCQELESETNYYNKRCSSHPYHSGDYEGLRSSLLGTRSRDQYVVLIISYLL